MIRSQNFDVPALVNWCITKNNRPDAYMADLELSSGQILSDRDLKKMCDGWAVIDRQGQGLPDFLGGFSAGSEGYCMVNATARAVIEDTDDVAHSFSPAHVWDVSDDAEDVANPLWIWRLETVAPTVDLTQSLLHRGTRGKNGPPFVALIALAPAQCVLLPNFTPPHSLWRDSETAQVFCTNTFKDAYTAAGLTSLDFVGTTPQ